MNAKKYTRKNYRLNENYVSKMNELRIRKSAEQQATFSETNIIEQAIDYYHSHVFGDKVKDMIAERLEREIHYAIDDALKNFMSEIIALFQILQMDLIKNQTTIEIILKILVSKLEVDTSSVALNSLVNNPTIFKEAIEQKINKEHATMYQYLKIVQDSKKKYLEEEENNEEKTEENHFPF